MKNYKLFISLASIISASYAANSTKVEQYNITKFAEVLGYVEQSQNKQHPEQLCLIYDMDNTILSPEPNLGSDSWMAWNSKLSPDNPNKITNWNLSNDLHGFEGALRFLIKYYPTESDTLATINKIKDIQRHPSIVMTARSYERYYAATENQLSLNLMNFKSNPIGISGTSNQPLNLIPNSSFTAYKAYFNGVYYSADDDKGYEILYLITQQRKINHNPNLCKTTIFVDNSATNTQNVYQAFLNSSQGFNLIALHYSAYDNYLIPSSKALSTWSIAESASQGQNLFNLIQQLNP